MERDAERYLTLCAKKIGGRAYKWVSPGVTGVPDRMVFLPDGQIVFVEVKDCAGRLTDRQKQVHRDLGRLGHAPYTVYGIDGVKRFFGTYGYEV